MWYSSNPEVATVDGGRITAVGFGQTVVTAQIGDQYASCAVKVLIDSPSGVIAGYFGGEVSSSGDLIEPGSRLVFGITNMSVETITVKSVQLFDGESEEGTDIVPIGTDLDSGLALKWTIDVPEAGIHSPTAVFKFTYLGDEYTCSAKYHSEIIRIVRRP